MPNIPEYESTMAQRGLEPSDRGTQAFAMEGRRVGAFYHQIGEDIGGTIKTLGDEYEQHVTTQQVSQGYKTASDLSYGLNEDLKQKLKNADPNDPNVIPEWRAQVMEPAIQKFQESFTTQRSKAWGMAQADDMRRELTRSALGYQSTVAAYASKANVDTAIQQDSALVYDNPAFLPMAVQRAQSTIEETIANSPHMSPDTAAQLREEGPKEIAGKLGMSAAKGQIDRDPTSWDKPEVRSIYEKMLSGEQMDQLDGLATRTVEAKVRAQEALDAQQRKQQIDQVDTALNQVRQGIHYGADGSVTVDPSIFDNLLKISTTLPGAKYRQSEIQAVADLARRFTTEAPKVKDDPATASYFNNLIGTPQLKQVDIDNAVAHGMLSPETAENLRRSAEDYDKRPGSDIAREAMKNFYTTMKPRFGAQDILGMPKSPDAIYRYNSLIQLTENTYTSFVVRGGHSPEEFVDRFLDQKSPDYLGNPTMLLGRNILLSPKEEARRERLEGPGGKGVTYSYTGGQANVNGIPVGGLPADVVKDMGTGVPRVAPQPKPAPQPVKPKVTIKPPDLGPKMMDAHGKLVPITVDNLRNSLVPDFTGKQ